MRKNNFKVLVFWSYFVGTFLLAKIENFGFSLNFWKNTLKDVFWWFLGAVFGAHFLKIEQLFNIFYKDSQQFFSLKVKELLKQKKLGLVWDLLTEKSGESSNMVLRSALFQVSWVFLALFVLTSTTSLFGKAFIMAIGFCLLLEEAEYLLEKRNLDWLFWQIKRKISEKEQKIFFWIMAGIFAFLTLILI